MWAKTQWEEKDWIDRKLKLREGRHDYDYKGEHMERRQSAVNLQWQLAQIYFNFPSFNPDSPLE